MNDPVWSLVRAAERYSGAEALISDDITINYRQYLDLSGSVSANLREIGVRPGDYVAVVAETDIRYPILLHGLWLTGAVACPINHRFPATYVAELLADIGCSFVLCDNREDLSDVDSNLTLGATDHLVDLELPRSDTASRREHLGDIHRPATVIFTSGSSSRPKGVLHSFANHYFSALGSGENIPFAEGDRWLLSLPLYHVGGLSILFRAMLGGGAVAIPSAKQDIADSFRRHQVSHASVVGTQLLRMLHEGNKLPPVDLKALLVGGGYLSPTLLREAVENGWPIHTSYGLTEMASQVATTAPGDTDSVLTGSTEILPYRQVRIAPDGEIMVKGETLSAGYLSGGTLSPLRDADGWFHTGDLGQLDSRGRLRVTGRSDSMFISGGENIQPEEIEKTALESCDVNRFVVVPVADEEFGQRPVAFAEGAAEEDEIKTALGKLLPSYKLPLRVFLWPEPDETEGIKPSRKVLTSIAKRLMAEQPH